MPRASAARDPAGAIGISLACASARAVAIPIRRPVNDPGPTPTAIRSILSQPPASSTLRSISPRSTWEWRGRPSGPGSIRVSRTTRPPAVTPTTASAVALSISEYHHQ